MNKYHELLDEVHELIESGHQKYVCDAIRNCSGFWSRDKSERKVEIGEELCKRTSRIIKGRFSLDSLWCEENPGKWDYDKDSVSLGNINNSDYWNFFRSMRLDLIQQLKEEFK